MDLIRCHQWPLFEWIIFPFEHTVFRHFPKGARGGRLVTAVVELDGAPYHGNRQAEVRRDRDLGVEVLHVDASEVGKPGLLTKIFDWLVGLLG